MVDLVTMQALLWDNDATAYRLAEIPAELEGAVQQRQTHLIEAAADVDDAVMAAFLSGESPSEAQLRAAIRKDTLSGAFVPVLAGSAFKNKGVELLLDAIVHYLPAPQDVQAQQGLATESGYGAQ